MTASSHRRWTHTSDLQLKQTRIIGCWSDRGTISPGRNRSVPSISVMTRGTSSTSINWLGSTSGPKAQHGALHALPRVRVFVTGSNVWHDAEHWPLPATKKQTWFLRSEGRANSLSGNGTLTREQPNANELADYYFYDPANPVQSLGGHSCCNPQAAPMGPMIQREVELRNDVLIYTSEPLERPLWVAGKVMAKLFAATTARDTDWVVKVCDVAPDGRSLNIQEGVIRARFETASSGRSCSNPTALTSTR